MDLYQYIGHPERLDHDSLYELRSILARYPYYQSARLLYLQNLYLLHDSSFGEELRKAAVYVADCRALFDLIEGKNYVIEPHERSMKEEAELQNSDRTLTLIDRFLQTLPKTEKEHKKVAVNPAVDYVAYLEQLEDAAPAEPTRADHLISQFISTHPTTEHVELPEETVPEETAPAAVTPVAAVPKTAEEPAEEENIPEDTCLTETLAKIYIKQKRYSKALEIIRRLNLNNPKKSAYFADQMRFLEKLIVNNKKNIE